MLGKIIGVYFGRPVEGWSYPAIRERFGAIEFYVAESLGVPLIVPDDDISGTFVFFRALADHPDVRPLDAAAVGSTWLNYAIEGRTILWWGGLNRSTEHTAYLRLKAGVIPPATGSIALNGRSMAEGWARRSSSTAGAWSALVTLSAPQRSRGPPPRSATTNWPWTPRA
ncbi:ADP-ribosylglycohydrolase family protein [Nonomuraea antimicrobica]